MERAARVIGRTCHLSRIVNAVTSAGVSSQRAQVLHFPVRVQESVWNAGGCVSRSCDLPNIVDAVAVAANAA